MRLTALCTEYAMNRATDSANAWPIVSRIARASFSSIDCDALPSATICISTHEINTHQMIV